MNNLIIRWMLFKESMREISTTQWILIMIGVLADWNDSHPTSIWDAVLIANVSMMCHTIVILLWNDNDW